MIRLVQTVEEPRNIDDLSQNELRTCQIAFPFNKKRLFCKQFNIF